MRGYTQDKDAYLKRLRRIEGQVRGLRQMIETHRYCGEAVQQSSAVIAALREVTLMLISQQLQGHVERLNAPAHDHDSPGINEFVDLLRTSYRFQ